MEVRHSSRFKTILEGKACSPTFRPTPSAATSASASSKLTNGSTISGGALPLIPGPITDVRNHVKFSFSNLFENTVDEETERAEYLARIRKKAPASVGTKISHRVGDVLVPSSIADRNLNVAHEQPDVTMGNENDGASNDVMYNSDGRADDEDIDEDGSNLEDTDPDLRSPSQCTHHPRVESDSDLEPGPCTQPPRVEPDSDSDPAPMSSGRKRKLVYSDNSFSSEVEIVEGAVDVNAKPAPQRLTSTTGLAVTVKAPAAKRLKSSLADTLTCITSHNTGNATSKANSHEKLPPRSQYRMKHLPEGCQTSGKWSGEVIPSLILSIGNQAEVWTLDEAILAATLQSIWDAVYKGKILHTVTTDGPVFAIAIQQLSEWRNAIGSVALLVLANFMSSQNDIKTDDDRKVFASILLERYAFLYGEITEDDRLENPFQSDLIIQVLVHHMSAVRGVVDVLGTTELVGAKGALGLATVAMERALRLIADSDIVVGDIDVSGKCQVARPTITGKENSVILLFSEVNWGSITRSYMKAINRQGDKVISAVSKLADTIATWRHGAPSTRSTLFVDFDDERALIC